MFDDKDINANYKKNYIREKNEKNIDLTITDLYSHIVAITYKDLREQNANNYLKSSLLCPFTSWFSCFR